MARLFALLVGINEYHPDSKVSSLGGCKQDVEKMAKYLQEYHKDVLGDTSAEVKDRLVVLTDAMATRKAVIESFNTHLGKANQDGDVALFYYAGHGSYEKTSPEFETNDPKNQNETLICYDSRVNGPDLADKELAVLINTIPHSAQKVIVLDSCHSGSATRAASNENSTRTRHQPTGKDAGKRPLDSYLKELVKPGGKNYYQELKDAGKEVEPPISRHILFSACDRDQLAAETLDNRGLFSSNLERVLKQYKGNPISYNDLFLQVRRSMLNQEAEQTPKIESLNGFNSSYAFLGVDSVDESVIPVTGDAAGQLKLELGATLGLPTDQATIDKIKVKLYEVKDGVIDENSGTDARIRAVGIEDSSLVADKAKAGKKYVGKLDYIPANMALPIYLNGSAKEKDKFKAMLEKEAPSPYLDFVDASTGCSYELRLEKTAQKDPVDENKTWDCYGIYNISTKTATPIQYLVFDKYDGFVKNAAKTLNQIAKWERIKNLKKGSSILPDKKVKINFNRVNRKRDKSIEIDKTMDTNDVHVLVDFNEAKKRSDSARFHFQIENDTDHILYFNRIVCAPKYCIAQSDKEIQVNFKLEPGQKKEMPYFFVRLNGTEEEKTIYFKLFASTVELTRTRFVEDEIELGPIAGDRYSDDEEDDVEPVEDWFVQSYSVTLSKNLGQIGETADDVPLSGITIKGQGKVKAKVSLGSLNNNTRSATTFDQIKTLEAFKGLNLVNLAEANTRGDMDKTIVELRDIEGDDDLEKNPLKIQIDVPIDEGETIIPITHDGEFILPIGNMERDDDGKPVVSITQIPDQPEEGKRSATRALKFAFLKAAAPDSDAFYKLRWVNPEAETDDKRSTIIATDLKQKVEEENVKRILLLVHGIIGDTLEMGELAMNTVLNNEEKKDGFDLVLTFDYENLNGPIENISAKLNEKLEEIGLGADDDKELFIVAHSMGGLVSRYMIENLRGGDTMVDRLIMFGTPNGGSAFSKIPDLLKSLQQLLSIALNFLPINVNGIMGLIDQFEKIKKMKEQYTELKDNEMVKQILEGAEEKGLEKYQSIKERLQIFVTLEQMDPKSEFLIGLGENPAPNTNYYVVAGDISNYKTQSGGWFARLMDKVVVKVGKLIYYKTPNDIAVSVEGIKKIPFDVVDHATVVCHHMNYFNDDDGVEKWNEYLNA